MNIMITVIAATLYLTVMLCVSMRAYRKGVRAGRLAAYADIEEPASWLSDTLRIEERIKLAKSNRRHLLRHIDETTIRILEQRFSTHLPAFQKRGDTYDPYDAMRRDAAREVILFLRQQLQLAEKENKD